MMESGEVKRLKNHQMTKVDISSAFEMDFDDDIMLDERFQDG